MKLIIQIPCYNEADTLKAVIDSIPDHIDGIDEIETLIIDDGSIDGTSDAAHAMGVNHIIRNTRNLGLAQTFAKGLEKSLSLGADIIINTDGDNQYPSENIPDLVRPVLEGRADIVVGNRGGLDNPHFSYLKKKLQVLGSRVISWVIGIKVPDVVSGFRALSRDAAKEIHILTSFSYTIEMLVQAATKNLKVISVPVQTNEKTRDSRLFKNVPHFLRMSLITLTRVQTMYRPLKVFGLMGAFLITLGSLPIIRFLYLYLMESGSGNIQSLILGGVLIVIGFLTIILGLLADLVAFNRKLSEKTLRKLNALEEIISKNK